MDGYIKMFKNIRLRFVVDDYRRWRTAVVNVDKQATYEAKNNPEKGATEFYQMLFRNIMQGRYTGAFAKHTKDYKKWKAGVTSKGYWRLQDHVLQYLNAFKVSHPNRGGRRVYAWMGGIPNGIKVTSWSWYGKKYNQVKELAVYAKYVEYGTSQMPARPVFGWTTESYWRAGFLTRKLSQSRKKIKDKWE